MKKIYVTKRKGVTLQNLQKPSPAANGSTKICSVGNVCKGLPLPNNRSHFYNNCSQCIACSAEISKQKYAEKKENDKLFFNH